MIPRIVLKPGREKPLLRRHPWVFSGAIDRIDGNPESGSLVQICASDGGTMGYAGYSPQSQIRCRMWQFRQDLPVNPETELAGLLESRIRKAVQARVMDPSLKDTNTYRLIHAESDQIPGLVVDKYGDVIVIQILSAGVETWRELITNILISICKPLAIFERSDAEVRALEGLPVRKQLLYGSIPTEGTNLEENGVLINVDIESGHKTGFYLDQRENRKTLRDFTANKEVLDCFCYTGGFSLNALQGGARSITAVDQSSAALDGLKNNLELNDFSIEKTTLLNEDVFQMLRKFRDQGKSWDVIVLDPPKFAPTRSQAQKAARGYKDINLLAAKLLRPGGYLFTFSCSGGIDQKLFQQIVAGAAIDAGANLQVISKMGQGSDHPVLLNFPEGEYLKGLICRRD